MINAVLGPKVEIKPKETPDAASVRQQHKNENDILIAKQMIEQVNKQRAEEIASVENDTRRLEDNELISIFMEYFSPNKEFFSEPGSPKHTAYFNAINTAKVEMLNNSNLFLKATKREQAELLNMINNPVPVITNFMICGLIFSTGKYAVIPSSLLCVDFAESIPNCIAIYLLLTAQKLPVDNRQQAISVGDGINKQPFVAAMDSLSVCDPSWK